MSELCVERPATPEGVAGLFLRRTEGLVPGTPRLTSADLAALRAIASGGSDVDKASRYWLSVYQLIDETPKGWRLTARGRDFLRRLETQTRGDAAPATDARFLMLSSSSGALHH